MPETVASELPPKVQQILTTLVDAATTALGDTLDAIVLYGSAAEGRLRLTSDLNVIIVLTAFDRGRIDALREQFRTAHAAIKLAPMFLLRDEIGAAAEAFAVYDLLVEVGARVDRPLTVILERDGAFPPMEPLIAELDRARIALAAGRARRRPELVERTRAS